LKSTTICYTACALFFLIAFSAQADDDTNVPDPQGAFFDVTNINVVNVEVYVTDKKGNPVTDLRREDFEVYENGHPIPVTNFYTVAGGIPQNQEQVELLPETAAGQPQVDLPVAVREDQRLHLIIYVDNFNLRPANRNRTLNRVNRFLRQRLDRRDRVMVVSYDRSLHIRQPFTTNKSAVVTALLEVEELTGNAVNRDADRRSVLEDIEDAQDSIDALRFARSYAELVFTEMEFTLRALEKQVEALSGLVGRKAVLYISDGIPLVVAEDIFIAVDEFHPRSSARVEAMAYSYSNRYREIVAKANAGGITFYSLDAGGLQGHQSISAEYGGTARGGGLAFIDSIRSANLQEPLYLIADDTGGSAIINTNAVEAGLGKMADDFRNYYSLGYVAPHNGDGRYYKVEVTVKRKGLKVRHRNGYRDKTPEARLTDGAIATLMFGSEINPMNTDIEFGRYKADGKHFLLPVEIKIPIGQLTLAPREDVYIGRLKLVVVVMDAEGSISPVQQQEPLSIRIPAQEVDLARQKYYSYAMTLAVRPGALRLAVGVRDEFSNETSFLRRTVKIEG
jgi:VWFA-related protein